jgi:hypothetical protein
LGAHAAVFPAWSEADWRKAAEAALKGKSVESLASTTADGIRIEPLYAPADGPRLLGPTGSWRVMARLDHPDPREANAQALDDLAGGADGLAVVFAGAIGAYGLSSREGHRAVRPRSASALRSPPRRAVAVAHAARSFSARADTARFRARPRRPLPVSSSRGSPIGGLASSCGLSGRALILADLNMLIFHDRATERRSPLSSFRSARRRITMPRALDFGRPSRDTLAHPEDPAWIT